MAYGAAQGGDAACLLHKNTLASWPRAQAVASGDERSNRGSSAAQRQAVTVEPDFSSQRELTGSARGAVLWGGWAVSASSAGSMGAIRACRKRSSGAGVPGILVKACHRGLVGASSLTPLCLALKKS